MTGAGVSNRISDGETASLLDRLNALAPSLGPDLLPNGRRAGGKWMFSGIADTGLSESAWLHLSGPRMGHWTDAGNAASGEQHGDMLDLVRLIRCGGDKRAAFDEARRILGDPSPFDRTAAPVSDEERRARRDAARKRAEDRERQFARERVKKARNAKRLWLRGEAIEGTPAADYLTARGLSVEPVGRWPRSLRFFDRTHHGPLGGKFPALLAAIYTADGAQIGTHRIFLQHVANRGWGKLTGAPNASSSEAIGIERATAKMVLGNMWGGFVPIHKGRSRVPMARMAEGEPVYVTEGIEDAIAVRMVKPEARIVAAISLGNIGAILLPEAARRLVIVADRDDKPAAQDALERAVAHQQSRGLDVSVVMPPPGIKDFNEWLLAGRAAA